MNRSISAWLGICTLATGHLFAASAFAEEGNATEAGKVLAFDRKKGNCLACHTIQGGQAAGNIAPPLIAMKARYPEKKKLRAQIWDATKANPESSMPPFGRHQVLSDSEIDKITDFIWSL